VTSDLLIVCEKLYRKPIQAVFNGYTKDLKLTGTLESTFEVKLAAEAYYKGEIVIVKQYQNEFDIVGLETGKVVQSIFAYDTILVLVLTYRVKAMLTLNDFGRVRIWDVDDGSVLLSFDTSKAVAVCELSNKKLAFGGTNLEVWEFSLNDGTARKESNMPLFKYKVVDMAEVRDGILAVSMERKNENIWQTKDKFPVHIFDVEMNQFIMKLKHNHKGKVYKVLTLPDGFFATVCKSTIIQLWNNDNLTCVGSCQSLFRTHTACILKDGSIATAHEHSPDFDVWKLRYSYVTPLFV